MTMDNPDRERRAARDEVIEYIAWFRCEYDSRAKTSDEDRDFARNLLEWLDADDLTVTPTDAASAAAGSDRERLYGYLENINSHLGSLRNAFGVVRHVENPKIGTPVYHLQAAEEYVSLLYNLMVKFVPDPDAAAESAEASGEDGA